MRRRTTLNLMVIVALLLSAVPLPAMAAPAASVSSSKPAQVSPDTVKVVIDAQAAEAIQQVAAAGGQLLQDYGAFSVWSVPVAQATTLANRSGVTLRPDFDSIGLRSGSIDTQAGEPGVPANLREAAGSGAQFWMVQYAGPIKGEWLTDLKAGGLEVVMYMPNNAYVVWGEAPQAKLTALAASNRLMQWMGAYHPAYRLAPALQKVADTGNASDWVDVTVQFYTTPATPASLDGLLKLSGKVQQAPERILGFTNISLQVPAGKLIELANQADVFNIEPWAAPQKMDEIQNQILAGNVISTGGAVVPNSPGYIAWLASKGFPTAPASYPIVDIVDDGIDQGNANNVLHPDFHELGLLANPDRVAYIGNCTTDATGNAVGGHGNLNSGIVGAYNNLAGFPYVDANGYRIGLGVSPYGRIAGTKIFANYGGYDVSNCGGTDQGVVAASYNAGANFTSNSWGSDAGGAYDSSAQAYDQLTRDASSATSGNQQMLHVFSAGNAGSSANTIGSPATAKNVLSVAATENVRDQGVLDGCGESAANNADDMATFSSRGPTDDGRYKPEISAPGTHVQGPASQDPAYNGTGVCNKYYPAGQTLYAWSSGTSHAAPAIAGTASLAWNYYGRVLKPGATPSPAMLKALLLNSTRYLQGVSTGDTLPSNNQGWGDANLGTLFDGTPRVIVDQSQLFTASGQQQLYNGTIMDPGKPFRVTVAWTDAPGSTTGNSYVNNLDLEVTVNGVTYKGNVFSGARSVSGGTADVKNNVESVFLPAGASGGYTVRVVATNLAGDGVPGSGTATDQDYALVIYNNSIGPVGTLQGQVRAASNNAPIANAQVSMYSVPTQTYTLPADASGNYSILLPVGIYTVTGSAYAYLPNTLTGVTVVSGTTTTQNIALTAAPTYVVSGTVRDALTGWPLYGKITIGGYPGAPVWTNPSTGFYSITLLAGTTYQFNATGFSAGYSATSQSVGPLTANTTVNLGLNVDAATCVAPGYRLDVTGMFEAFNAATTPAGWAVTSSGTCPWRFDDPYPRGNLTGGTGGFAIADSDFCGSGSTMSATLTSPAFNVSALGAVNLSFNYDYNNLVTTEVAAVDVSANNGTTWSNVVTWNTDQRGPALFSQDVTSLLSGATQAKLRYRYVAPGFDWWWEVDNAFIGEKQCLPNAGGLVVGTVNDANTASALNSATIRNQSGYTTTATVTPDDPNVGDGYYTLFSPSGSQTITATAVKYAPGVAVVSVPVSGTVRQDFGLGAGILNYTPGAITVSLTAGQTSSVPVVLTNTGNLALAYALEEIDLGNVPYGATVVDIVPWLSEAPVSGTIATAATQSVNVTLNSVGAQPGVYRAALRFSNDTPYSVPNLPVTFNVTALSTWGKLAGNVSTLGYCDANPAALAGVTVTLQSATQTWDLPTDNTGAYAVWLNQAYSPLTATVNISGYQSTQITGINLVGQTTTTNDFSVRWLKPCMTINPSAVAATLSLGQSTTRPFRLTNAGAASTVYSMTEQNVSSPVVNIPASDGNFPRGSAPASIGRAPQTVGPAVVPEGASPLATLAAAVPAYALDLNNSTLNKFNDLAAPGTWSTIGSTGTDFYPAGDFLGNDFTKLYALDNTTKQLVTFNTTSAARTLVGASTPATGESWTGLTGSATGILYASGTTCSASSLYTINPATGAATLIGAITNGACIIDLAIDASGNLYGIDISADTLVKINPSTGAGTVVGSIGYNANYAQGMDFDNATGVLYVAAYNYDGVTGTGELRIASTTTGNTTLVGIFPGGTEVDGLAIATGGGGAGSDVLWLTETPVSGTLASDTFLNATIGFDANGVALPGTYTANVNVNSNDPRNPARTANVTMNVTAPASWGVITGTVNSQGRCDANLAPLAGAIVVLQAANGLTRTVTTGANGGYTLWLNSLTNPYTLTATAAQHVGSTPVSGLTVGQLGAVTAASPVNLRSIAPCVTYTPAGLSVSVPWKGSASQTLTLTNSGAASSLYTITEESGGFVPLRPQANAPMAPLATGFNEGFEGATFPPTGWTRFEVDGSTTYQWVRLTTGAHTGTGMAYHSYGTGPEDGMLILPDLPLADTPQLSFWEKAADPDFYDPAGGHTVWACTASCDAPPTNYTQVAEIGQLPDFSWRHSTVDLSAFANQTVRLAFRYYGDFADGWALDDVSVTGLAIDYLTWLTEAPVKGTVAAETGLQTVAVNFDATVAEITQPGTYYGTLRVATADAGLSSFGVPVTMTVVPTTTQGKLNGTVTGLGYCDVNPAPLSAANAIIQNALGVTHTLTTNAAGYYQEWIDQGPYTVTVAPADYASGTITGTVTGGLTTTLDLNLRWLKPCIGTTPAAGLSANLAMGVSTTLPMTLRNSGAFSLTFSLKEADRGFTPLSAQAMDVLVVNDGGSNATATRAFTTALTNLGYTYYVTASSSATGVPVNLLDYQYVIWAGSPSIGAEATQLIAYMDAGGSALVANNDFGYSMGGTPLYATYFEAVYSTDSGSKGVINGQDIMAGISTDISSNPYPDNFTISGTHAVGIFVNASPNTNLAGLRIQRNAYKAIMFAWDFNYTGGTSITATVKTDVLQRAMNWLKPTDLLWLSANVTSGTVAPSGAQAVNVTFDAGAADVTQPGTYQGAFVVVSNDPVHGGALYPVTMTVSPPATWGKLTGLVNGLAACNLNPTPMPDAVVYVENGSGLSWTLKTDVNGVYQLWTPAANSPLTVTASNEAGYEAQTAAGLSVTAQQTTTHNFDLRRYAPCASVAPDQLSSTQAASQVTTKILTLGNVGASEFDWSIKEDLGRLAQAVPQAGDAVWLVPGMFGGPASDVVGHVSETIKEPRPSDIGRASQPYLPAAVLWDNGPLVTHVGGGAAGADASALQSALAMTSYGVAHSVAAGYRVADDFVVSGGTWQINTITFFAYQTGSGTVSTINHVNLRIWNGVPGAPGSAIVWGDTTTNRLNNTVWSNIYRALDTGLTNADRPIMADTAVVGLSLAPGTYWVDWQTGGTGASGPWAPPVTILNQTTTGNARQYDFATDTWVDITDVGPQGLPFIVEGNIQGASGCAADLPWVSALPVSGTLDADSQIPVSVTFNSTGLANGGYFGNLCVNTTDPRKPRVIVPVSLFVADCAAKINDAPTIYNSVQAAVDASGSPSDVVKVAGYCPGVESRTGLTQTVIVTKALTIQGGYATTNWTTPYPMTQPTTLDALNLGRVVVIKNNASVTLENLNIVHGNGYVGGKPGGQSEQWGGGVYALTSTLHLLNSQVSYNTGFWGGGVANEGGVLTLTHAALLSNTVGMNGGGLANYHGQAVVNDSQVLYNQSARSSGGLSNHNGQLVVNRSTIGYNVANTTTTEQPGYGTGGLSNVACAASSFLTINDSQVIGNANPLGGGGGGIGNHAGGGLIANLVINRSAIANNSTSSYSPLAGFGGGINNGRINLADCPGTGGLPMAFVTVNDSVIKDNRATNGGGIGNGIMPTSTVEAMAMMVTLNNTTVSGNVAGVLPGGYVTQTGNGGGIFNVNGTVTAINSTFSGNAATTTSLSPYSLSGNGGAIGNGGAGLPTSIVLTHTTIAENSAFLGAGVANAYLLPMAGGYPATVATYGSIIANNTALAGAPYNGCINTPGYGVATITSRGYNLERGNTCTFSATGDLTNTNPLLGALANNGGPITGSGLPAFTHALLNGSPAINLIPAAACTVSTDQRGQLRPAGSGCDSGAYEAKYTLTVNTTGMGQGTVIVAKGYGSDTALLPAQFTNIAPGTVITFTAVPSVTSDFAGWSGAISGTANPVTLTVNADTVVTATFTIKTFTLTPAAAPNGSITPNALQTVNYGDSQVFTITANAGYHILDVGVDNVSVGAVSSYTFTNITAHHSIAAAFTADVATLYTLTVTLNGNGSVISTPPGWTCASGPCATAFAAGSAVILTATANAGSTFAGWSGAVVTTTNPLVLTMDAAKAVTATFKIYQIFMPVIRR